MGPIYYRLLPRQVEGQRRRLNRDIIRVSGGDREKTSPISLPPSNWPFCFVSTSLNLSCTNKEGVLDVCKNNRTQKVRRGERGGGRRTGEKGSK